MPLNKTNRSDYYFGGADNKTRQFSRKQAGELLSSIDEAERQIRDYYNNADENYQIIEGIISPVSLTRKDKSLESISIRSGFRPDTLFAYQVAPSGYIFNEKAYNTRHSFYISWLFQLDQCGVKTFHTLNYVETAQLLVAIYKSCDKSPEEHGTLQRITKPRIQLKHHEPFVRALVYLSSVYHLQIGEAKATEINKHFHSLLDLAMADVIDLCQVEGIGKKMAENMLKSIGRDL